MTIPPSPELPPPAAKVKETTTVTTEVTPAKDPSAFSRRVEDGGLLMCAVMFFLWMLGAVLRQNGYIVGPCKDMAPGSGFPWEFVVSGATFAIPKILGRATGGRIWDKIAGRT